jgi:hypothetical protein
LFGGITALGFIFCFVSVFVGAFMVFVAGFFTTFATDLSTGFFNGIGFGFSLDVEIVLDVSLLFKFLEGFAAADGNQNGFVLVAESFFSGISFFSGKIDFSGIVILGGSVLIERLEVGFSVDG